MDIIHYLESAFSNYGYFIIFLSAFIESIILLNFLLPGSLIVLLGGYYAQNHQFSVILVIILAWLGMFLGDLVNYWLGKKEFHNVLIKNNKLRHILTNRKLAENYIYKYGILAIFCSHFIGYIRSIICFTAGITVYPQKKYIIIVSIASFCWSILFVGLGYFFGKTTDSLQSLNNNVIIASWLVILFIVVTKIIQNRIQKIFSQKKKK